VLARFQRRDSTPRQSSSLYTLALKLHRPALKDFTQVLARFQRRGSTLRIKALLLDQAFAAGVGNWVADEILYQVSVCASTLSSSLLARKKQPVVISFQHTHNYKPLQQNPNTPIYPRPATIFLSLSLYIYIYIYLYLYMYIYDQPVYKISQHPSYSYPQPRRASTLSSL
jgi:hypothetical protein